MNFSQAIKLLEAASEFNLEPLEKKPNFTIYDNQKQGYTLWTKKHLINGEYCSYLEELVKSRRLAIRELEGYLIIYSP